MKIRAAINLITLISAFSAHYAAVAAEPVPVRPLEWHEVEKLSDSDLISRLSAEERELLNQSTPERRKSMMESLRNDIKNGTYVINVPRGLYVPDPALVAIYKDYHNVEIPADDVVKQFQAYINDHPNSEFVPEIYARMAFLKTIHRRKIDDPFDLKLSDEYLKKAVQGMGTKFSYLNNTARASISNMATDPAEKVAYYKWLMGFVTGGVSIESVSNLREFAHTYNGRFPAISDEDMKPVISGVRANLPMSVNTAERNLLHWAGKNPARLAFLSSELSEYPLGKEASSRLNLLDSGSKDASAKSREESGDTR